MRTAAGSTQDPTVALKQQLKKYVIKLWCACHDWVTRQSECLRYEIRNQHTNVSYGSLRGDGRNKSSLQKETKWGTVVLASCIQMCPNAKQNKFSVWPMQPCPFLPVCNWPWARSFIVCISSTVWILCKAIRGLFPYSHKLCHSQSLAEMTQTQQSLWCDYTHTQT